MEEILASLGSLPTVSLVAALGVVMMLDAIPLVGVLVPGDVAVLAAIGAARPTGGLGVLLAVVAGCLAGWSLSFLAGRYFGERLRGGRVGGWVGEARWAAAERALSRGGSRMVLVAPFLPVLNALIPLAAGGLRMPYLAFVGRAAAGAALWGGLYVALGLAGEAIGGALLDGASSMLVTVGIGLTFGWVVLLLGRRRRPETV